MWGARAFSNDFDFLNLLNCCKHAAGCCKCLSREIMTHSLLPKASLVQYRVIPVNEYPQISRACRLSCPGPPLGLLEFSFRSNCGDNWLWSNSPHFCLWEHIGPTIIMVLSGQALVCPRCSHFESKQLPVCVWASHNDFTINIVLGGTCVWTFF